MQKVREQMQTGGDVIALREKFAELNQELDTVKSEINALRGRIFDSGFSLDLRFD